MVLTDHTVCRFSVLCAEKRHTMEKNAPLCRRRKTLAAQAVSLLESIDAIPNTAVE
jgi:hypothetical protein